MDDWTPLNIYSDTRPTPGQLEILKAAKKASGVTTKCKPVRAVAGCGRVLVLGPERPTFLCEWANTSWDDPKLSAKVRWVLTGEGGSPKRWADWLSDVFGTPVREITSSNIVD